MADGSVIIDVDVNPDDAEKEFNKLSRQVSSLEDKIEKTTAKKMPLVEQAKKLGAELDAAKQKLFEMESAGGVSSNRLKLQKEDVAALQSRYNAVQSQVERYERQIESSNFDLDYAKNKAGELQKQISNTGKSTEKMASAMERAQKSARRFGNRLREVLRSALIFSVISRALAQFRDWMATVIRTNDEAMAAFARLKGALLTLAQPLVEVLIPAFITFVNILTKIVTAIASLVSAIFGKSLSQSKTAAKNLNAEAKAIEGVGGAAEEAAGSLAGFDEINTIATESAGGGGGGGGSGSAMDLAPSFDFDTADLTDNLDKILNLVKAIGAALLAWKLATGLGDFFRKFLGILLAIDGAIGFIEEALDAWNNGISMDNFLGMLGRALELVTGLWIAFGSVGAGIGLIVSGLAMLVVGIRDALENGWNFENMLTTIAGIIMTGLGISILVGSWIPALIAAIASLLVAFAVNTGHGEELLNGIRKVMEGFVDFVTGVFSGDIEKAIDGVGKIFDGLKTIAVALVEGLRDTLLGFLDWLDEKTNGKLKPLIDALKNWVNTRFDNIKKIVSGTIDSLKTIFSGLIQFVSGVFTGDWERAWEGIKNIFKGVFNVVLNILETAINNIIRGINWMINQLNKLQINIPDWLGGGTIGFSISNIRELSIPRLAQGSVVPPNREFLALLGDNKQETEVVSPLSTIEEALENVLSRMGGGGNTEIRLVVDSKTLARVVVPKINDMTREAGKSVLLV